MSLTNRWSQPLAVAVRRFDFIKEFSMFATLAAASGVRLVRRIYRMSIESDIVERVNRAASKKQIPISDTKQK